MLGVDIRAEGNWHIDGLVYERRNTIANTLELRLSWTNPSIFYQHPGCDGLPYANSVSRVSAQAGLQSIYVCTDDHKPLKYCAVQWKLQSMHSSVVYDFR